MLLFNITKIFVLSIFSYTAATVLTPLLTNFLYKYKLGKQIRPEKSAPIFYKFHKQKSGTPTMAGLLIWLTTTILALVIFELSKITNLDIFKSLNFLSRKETLLPLGALVASGIIGAVDDILNVKKIGPNGGGLKMWHKLLIYTSIAGIGAWWFYSKLSWDVIHIPFFGNYNIGLWYIACFVIVLVSTSFSANETDGLDGLAGGVLLTSFLSYGIIAFVQGRFNLAAFCGVIIGSLIAFLWFNIPPARFFMGDTGSMSLGITLGIVAMLTNEFFLLPIICFIFVIESMSVIIQVISKKIRKKKIFLSTPIHQNFQAKGWPESKIVMRFWLISGLASVIGLSIFLIEQLL